MNGTTKHALAEALKELLESTTLDHITVGDIVKRANVSRQTFYYHFSDLNKLIEWAFRDTMKELNTQEDAGEEQWSDRLVLLMKYFRTHRALVINVYYSLGAEYLGRGLEKAFRPLIDGAARKTAASLSISEDNMDFAVTFFTLGVVGTILAWLENGMPEELVDVIENISRILNAENEQITKEMLMQRVLSTTYSDTPAEAM